MKLSVEQMHALAYSDLRETTQSLRNLALDLRRLADAAWQRAEELQPAEGNIVAWPAERPKPGGDELPVPKGVASELAAVSPRSGAEERASDGNDVTSTAKKKRRKVSKPIDMGAYHQRRIALEVMYVGWGFVGSTFQPAEPNTVEGELLRALERTRLIAAGATIEDIQLSRSGRTDRGVSGLGQVIALCVRSSGRIDAPLPPPEAESDYCATLNKALPPEIRILGWTDVAEDFSARFSAQFREYRYAIPHTGNLDAARMRAAGTAFVGRHDFRNFCKADAEHVAHFEREIVAFEICEGPGLRGGWRVIQVTIRGSAFLWHQVRCMIAVLCLVGRGLEQPEIVRQLLDVVRFGDKPQYNMADEEPLLLYACGYAELRFRRTAHGLTAARAAVNGMLSRALARVDVLQSMSEGLDARARECAPYGETGDRPAFLRRAERYVCLVKRPRELALELKFAKFGRTLGQPARRDAVERAL